MKKINCPKCGSVNNADNIFCANCEEILTNSVSGQEYIKRKKRERRRMGITLFIFALAVGIYALIWSYVVMYERIQGVWSGSGGDLMLYENGGASVAKASFAPNGAYQWRICPVGKLKLISEEDSGVAMTYKVKVNPEGDYLELTEVGDRGRTYEFREPLPALMYFAE